MNIDDVIKKAVICCFFICHTIFLTATTTRISDTFGFIESEMQVSENDKVEINDNTVSGSAPITITFTANPPAEAIYTVWEIATDDYFSNIILRFYDTEFSYSFIDYGTFYVRFYCADGSGTTEGWSNTYTVIVRESKLLCPNAFTPYGSPGVNDEWKVVSRSIINFDCVIFNRWGNEVAHLTSVDQGWDGTYKGKLVKPGVYFYVIKAKGADGHNYNISGDINLIGRRTE